MEFKKKTIIWEDNTEPPKNYFWVKPDGKVYEFTLENGWAESTEIQLCPGAEPIPEPEPQPEPEPTPVPVEATWANLNSEAAWNAEYQNEDSALRKYYAWSDEANAPYKEDLWNTVENRPANGTDILTEDGTFVWDGGVPVTDENGTIYTNCERCWKGAINAPEASYPWAVVEVPVPFEGTISLSYKGGEPVYPWGEEDREFGRGFAVASIPNELGMPELKINEAGEAETTLEEGDLVVTLIPKGASSQSE